MSISYEAHPLNHGGEPDVTVEFKLPDHADSKERASIMAQAADEVARRERAAGMFPLERVVFSAHDSQSTPTRSGY